MAWSDGATMSQIGAWFNMVKWELKVGEEVTTGDYLKAHANRRQMSDELERVRGLKIARRLNRDNLFDSPLWDDYER